MILLLALVAGVLAGFGWARWYGRPYQPPDLRYFWLAFVAFLPQFIVVNLPFTRERFPDRFIAASLLISQLLFLGFGWLNRRLPGMPILICGVILNFAVTAANGGFMPISPQTAGRLVSQEVLLDIPPGSRFGTKDILLLPENTRFVWLADRFLTPTWSPYQVAFSLGDVLIATGVFWLLAYQGRPEYSTNRGVLL